MANIKVELDTAIKHGLEIKFKSPCDCSSVTGLSIYYPDVDGNQISKTFLFADAHGNNVGGIGLFANNVIVSVILDTNAYKAYVQNADTNAYLESRFNEKASTVTYTTTIPSSSEVMWGLTKGKYYVTVDVNGILESDNPIVDVVLSDTKETAQGQLEAWGKISRIVTSANSITVYCYDEVPTTAIPIQLKVVR